MIDFKIKKLLIWDWNGTLLDDVQICIDCMNKLLGKRGLPVLNKARYKDIFTFPVKAYYEKAGFDFIKEPFEVPAMEFIHLYHEHLQLANLHAEVVSVLQFFRDKELKQVVLSAMEHDSLVKSLREKGIINFFDLISGINNHYAHSKMEIGKALVEKTGIAKKEIVLIGDSLHDLDVSKSLGFDCLLVAKGHQSKDRLVRQSPFVVDELGDLVRLYDQV